MDIKFHAGKRSLECHKPGVGPIDWVVSSLRACECFDRLTLNAVGTMAVLLPADRTLNHETVRRRTHRVGKKLIRQGLQLASSHLPPGEKENSAPVMGRRFGEAGSADSIGSRRILRSAAIVPLGLSSLRSGCAVALAISP